jgi:hypothetical protein
MRALCQHLRTLGKIGDPKPVVNELVDLIGLFKITINRWALL